MVGEMRDKETTVDRHRSLAHRPPGVRDPAHQQRAGIDRPPARHGHGPVQLRRRAARHPRAAPGEAPVQVQAAVHARRRTRSRACSRSTARSCSTRPSSRRTRRPAYERVYKDLVKDLRQREGRVHALPQGAATPAATPATRAGVGPARAAGRHRRDQEAHPGARAGGRDARDRARGRHAHAEAWTASRRCCRASPTCSRCARSASSSTTRPRYRRSRSRARPEPDADDSRRIFPAPRPAESRSASRSRRRRTSTSCSRRSWSRPRRSRNADGGTLYLIDARSEQVLRVRDRAHRLARHRDGRHDRRRRSRSTRSTSSTTTASPNNSMVAAYRGAHRDSSVNIADAYTEEGFDFSGTQELRQEDRLPLEVVPDRADEEPRGRDHRRAAADQRQGPGHRRDRRRSRDADQRLAESLASQAAIALTNRLLINQLEDLFESFINLINAAIDDKSPYTGGHCQRVPELTMMLAEAVNDTRDGPLADFAHDRAGPLRAAGSPGLLHDCGKVTTPVHVVDKATKLRRSSTAST